MRWVKTITQIVFIVAFLVVGMPNVNAEINDITTMGWGYKKNNNHSIPDIGSYSNEIEGLDAYYVDMKNPSKIYLTFDAGYDNGNLSKILDTLQSKNVKATFFVTGDFVKRFPDLLNRIVSEGHLVGNHSYAHKNIAKISEKAMFDDINKLEKAYYDATGVQMMKIFRPPEGSFTKDKLKSLTNAGYKTYFWSLAYCDWDVNKQLGVDKTVEVVMKNLHPGAFILMHSVSSSNQEALPIIIDKIREQDYQFGIVTEVA